MPMILGGSGTINTSSSLAVAVAGVEDMRIDANGNVGIGTTTPTRKLTISRPTQEMNEQIELNVVGGIQDNFFDGIRFTQSTGTYLGGLRCLYANNGAPSFAFNTRNNSNVWRVDDAGRVTTPNQPAFHAYPSVGSSVATNTVFPMNIAPENQGNCYNTSTYRFTAPVTGRYLFTFYTLTTNDGAVADIRLWINGSNPDLYGGYAGNQTGHKQVTSTWLIRLNVNDYVEVRSFTTSYMYGVPHTGFSGFLIG